MKLFYVSQLLSVVTSCLAFSTRPQIRQGSTRHPHHVLHSSYLDSLARPYATAPLTSSPTAVAPPATSSNEFAVGSDFVYAPLTYFGLDQLTSKGPRTTADWGTPHEATRQLADDDTLCGGSWWCSEGGWPSPNPKAHTEVFYVGKGHGCLSDADGVRHYFGPGDTVIIPKGHTGRWDVNQDIHKVWAVNDHARIEERGNPIRVQVIHYQDYHLNTGTPQGYGFQPAETLYDVGPTQVGIWTGLAGSTVKVTQTKRIWFIVLEGVLVISSDEGRVQRCEAGDTVMLPLGWSGYIEVVKPVKKLWVQAD